MSKSIQDLVQNSQSILKSLGHEVSADHVFTVYSQLTLDSVTEEDFISQSKEIFSGLGYKISLGHLRELFSQVLGHRSWNVASAKGENLSKVIVDKDPLEVALSYFETMQTFQSFDPLFRLIKQKKVGLNSEGIDRFFKTLPNLENEDFLKIVILIHEIKGWAARLISDSSIRAKLEKIAPTPVEELEKDGRRLSSEQIKEYIRQFLVFFKGSFTIKFRNKTVLISNNEDIEKLSENDIVYIGVNNVTVLLNEKDVGNFRMGFSKDGGACVKFFKSDMKRGI